MNKKNKLLAALGILTVVTYGLSLASKGVSIPGCGEGAP